MNKESRSKKEELKTYAVLGLKRTLKSRSQRRRMITRGAQLILGSGQPDEPEIIVRRDHYIQIRMEVLAEKLKTAQKKKIDLPREALLDSLAPALERETYQRLLALSQNNSRIESAFLHTHSRLPTRAEQKLFNQSNPGILVLPPAPEQWRENVLDQVLEAVEDCRKNSSSRLQLAWVELVGTEIAQQSSLEKVENGIAWFRCLNSALSYTLQRRVNLPAKLTILLKRTVQKVRACY